MSDSLSNGHGRGLEVAPSGRHSHFSAGQIQALVHHFLWGKRCIIIIIIINFTNFMIQKFEITNSKTELKLPFEKKNLNERPFSPCHNNLFDSRWEGCGDQIHCLAPSCPQPQWIKRPREWGGSASAGQPPALEMNDQLL